MSKTQLFREYMDFTSMHVNPPSFDEWLRSKNIDSKLTKEDQKEFLEELIKEVGKLQTLVDSI